MKTALQELIDYIDHMQNVYIKKSKETKDKNYQKGVEAILTATTLIKIQAKDNLVKEKEQLEIAFDLGRDEVTSVFIIDGEDYYNKKFDQNK
jgi:hypothetical protein